MLKGVEIKEAVEDENVKLPREAERSFIRRGTGDEIKIS